VVLRFGAVTGEVKPEGLYFIVPFVEKVAIMDVQIHRHTAKAAAASRDLQNVRTAVALNYRVNPEAAATVYQTLRRDYETRIIDPTVQEAVKATTALYNAEELITKRAAVRDGIHQALVTRLSAHGLTIDQVSIADFSFDPDFSAAIEEKMVAAQVALKAENELRTAKVQAESRIAQARGEAEAIRIQAEAIRSQGGAEYVNLKAIERWNGALPVWMQGGAGGAVPFVNVPAPHKQ
jgi:regulator of protease activity HflC (stomatin/prohibitin superfamily)